MKLTNAQKIMLHDAFLKARKDAIYNDPEMGWFYPTRYETTRVYGVPATAAVLCGQGLLEFKTVSYIKAHGKYKAVNEYRITDTGKQTIANLTGETR